MTGSGHARAIWSLVLAAAIGCGHRAPKPDATPKPIVAAVLPQVPVEAKSEFEGALRLLKLGKKHHSEARARLLKATQLDGRFFEAWHNLGWLDASRGNFARAAAAFRRALDIQPASRETALALGETWRRAGYSKKAAQLYGERLAAEPGDMELRNRYIQVLRDGGDLEGAMTQTKIALGQAGENVAQTVLAYNSLGLIYYKMEKFELAETALRKALALDDHSPFVWNNLGLVAFARGRDQEAFVNFQKASEIDPKYVEARLNKAIIFMDCGDYKHARSELQRAVDASPNDASALVALGVAARGDGKWDESRRAYEKALELEPEHAPALYDLGILYMEFDKDPVKATDAFAQFIEIADEDDPRRKDANQRLKELGASKPKPADRKPDKAAKAERGDKK